MDTYLTLLDEILNHGCEREDRTGTGTLSLFGKQLRFNLQQGYPLLTTKKMFTRGIIEELLWFLRGSTNAKELEDIGVNIWKEWGDPVTREMGPIYGKQWRSWETTNGGVIDQISNLVNDLKNNPYSRRHIVTAWNPSDIDKMALPPCHCLFQFYVSPLSDLDIHSVYFNHRESLNMDDRRHMDKLINGEGRKKTIDDLKKLGLPTMKLSCQLYQRSADYFLGSPFNIASYSLLTMMLAQQCGYAYGDFVYTLGDVHLYKNHIEQAREQLTRLPHKLPKMYIDPAKDIFSYTIDSFKLVGYESHPAISAPISV